MVNLNVDAPAIEADAGFESDAAISDAPAREQLPDPEFKRQLASVIPHLRAFGRSLSGNRDLADDLVQETLLKAWAARDRFEAGSNMRAWTFIILRNLYFSQMRRARFKGEWDDLVADRLLAAPAKQSEAVELMDMWQLFAYLPQDQQEALFLVGAHGLSYEDTAEIAQVAVGTIKSRVARGRLALENFIEDPESAQLGKFQPIFAERYYTNKFDARGIEYPTAPKKIKRGPVIEYARKRPQLANSSNSSPRGRKGRHVEQINISALKAKLAISDAIASVFEYRKDTNEWPDAHQGIIRHGPFANKMSWADLDNHLRAGNFGLVPVWSLEDLINQIEARSKEPPAADEDDAIEAAQDIPPTTQTAPAKGEPLSLEKIKESMRACFEETGRWPDYRWRGLIKHGPYKDQFRWSTLANYITRGLYGLPKGHSLKTLAYEIEDGPNPPPKSNVPKFLTAAELATHIGCDIDACVRLAANFAQQARATGAVTLGAPNLKIAFYATADQHIGYADMLVASANAPDIQKFLQERDPALGNVIGYEF